MGKKPHPAASQWFANDGQHIYTPSKKMVIHTCQKSKEIDIMLRDNFKVADMHDHYMRNRLGLRTISDTRDH